MVIHFGPLTGLWLRLGNTREAEKYISHSNEHLHSALASQHLHCIYLGNRKAHPYSYSRREWRPQKDHLTSSDLRFERYYLLAGGGLNIIFAILNESPPQLVASIYSNCSSTNWRLINQQKHSSYCTLGATWVSHLMVKMVENKAISYLIALSIVTPVSDLLNEQLTPRIDSKQRQLSQGVGRIRETATRFREFSPFSP